VERRSLEPTIQKRGGSTVRMALPLSVQMVWSLGTGRGGSTVRMALPSVVRATRAGS